MSCCYKYISNPKLIMNASWSLEQENRLREFEAEFKCDWKKISNLMFQNFPSKERTPKQCRERFINYARFGQSETTWTNHQASLLFECIAQQGFQWEKISPYFINRSGNFLKNKFNNNLQKFLRKLNLVLIKEKQLKIAQSSLKRLLDLSQFIPNEKVEDKFAAIRTYIDYLQEIKFQLLEKALLQSQKQMNIEWALDYRYRLYRLNKQYKSITYKRKVKDHQASSKISITENYGQSCSDQKNISDSKQQLNNFEVDSLMSFENLLSTSNNEKMPELKELTKQLHFQKEDPFLIGDQFSYLGH